MRPTEKITLNLGVRFERNDGILPEQSSPAGRFAPARSFPEIEVLELENLGPARRRHLRPAPDPQARVQSRVRSLLSCDWHGRHPIAEPERPRRLHLRVERHQRRPSISGERECGAARSLRRIDYVGRPRLETAVHQTKARLASSSNCRSTRGSARCSSRGGRATWWR